MSHMVCTKYIGIIQATGRRQETLIVLRHGVMTRKAVRFPHIVIVNLKTTRCFWDMMKMDMHLLREIMSSGRLMIIFLRLHMRKIRDITKLMWTTATVTAVQPNNR